MLLLVHDGRQVVSILRGIQQLDVPKGSVLSCLLHLADSYPDDQVVWCRHEYQEYIDLAYIESHLEEGMLWSYEAGKGFPLGKYAGYLDPSPFVKVKAGVKFPTWQMSSIVGAICSNTLAKCRGILPESSDLDIFLNLLARRYMPAGLFCYSNPLLLKTGTRPSLPLKNYGLRFGSLFQFSKQDRGSAGVVLLFFCLLFFEKKLALFPLLRSIRHRRLPKPGTIRAEIKQEEMELPSIDVIVPTIGRKQYLYDVLRDLNRQTHLPKRVIIVEQNPAPESSSELEEIVLEKWKFEVVHEFIHQMGACNARNLALSHVSGDWVFLNDDDNQISPSTIENALKYALALKVDCVVTAYPQPHETSPFTSIHQSAIFGSGNAFLKSRLLAEVKFDMRYEFGYGEDTDFGMQLRNAGADVIMVPYVKIIHLKAPFGGFRVTPEYLWSKEPIQPKPSPTIMLFKLLHETPQQYLRYKVIAFLSFYKSSGKNLVTYLKSFAVKWDSSVKWAKTLRDNPS